MSTEVERILGAMNSREIQVLQRLVSAQARLADAQYMNSIYLPNLESRLTQALQAVVARERPPGASDGQIDMGNENGVDYKIVFRSNQRVPVIKFLRELWSYGLKEAKDISDLAWDDRVEWNTLVVRNDTQFNMVNARALIEDHKERDIRLRHISSNSTPFVRIETV